jgi:hypothetical protein
MFALVLPPQKSSLVYINAVKKAFLKTKTNKKEKYTHWFCYWFS